MYDQILKICLQQNFIVIKFWKSTKFFFEKFAIFFSFFYTAKRKCLLLKQKMDAECPVSLVIYILDKVDTVLQLQISICKFGLSVCLFVSNKRQNGWIDRAQFFCGTSRDPREGLWRIEFSKICLHQNSIFKNPRNLFFVLFYNVHIENMFTLELEDEREACLSLV